MNTSDYRQAAIGMPESPLWLGLHGEELDGGKIHLVLRTEDEFEARLITFNSLEKYLTASNGKSEESTKISFEDLLFLHFLQEHRFNLDDVPAVFKDEGVELPSWNERYDILLKNGHHLEGEMKSCLVDETGIHLFRNENDLLQRFFIPHASIEKSRLGKKIGDELLSRNVVKAKQISQALYDQNIYKNKKIGEFLLDRKIITEEDLEKVLEIQDKLKKRGKTDIRIGDILIQENILTQKKFDDVLKAQKQKKDAKIGDILIDMGYASDLEVHRVLSNKLSVPLILLNKFKVNRELINTIPFDIAKKHSVFPLDLIDDRLFVTFNDPMDKNLVAEIQRLTGKVIEIAISPKQDIEDALVSYYGSFVIENGLDELEKFHLQTVPDSTDHQATANHLLDTYCAKPLVDLVNYILQDALAQKVSVIHVRPARESVDLLYRYDDLLVKQHTFHKALLSLIIGRLKIIGEMDIHNDESAQSGIASIKNKDEICNTRLSIIPTVNGESAVIHLTDMSSRLDTLQELGFKQEDLGRIVELMDRGPGLILVCGPGKSGKSASLYALLRELIRSKRNIVTLEESIEQYIDGATQIDVNRLLPSSGSIMLKRIQQHDPDAIMLSDIFDASVAKPIVNSTSSLHLVLAAMEMDTADDVITELLSMGVDSVPLSNSLQAIVLQRLARKNCENCLEAEDIDPAICKHLNVEEDETFYAGIGCESCNGSGFRGKMLIYELLQITDQSKAMIAEGRAPEELFQDVEAALSESALELARTRKISLKEACRVTSRQ